MEIEIFSVLPPEDGHFQDVISRVRAPVTYLPSKGLKVAEFWSALEQAGETLPDGWLSLEAARGEDVRYVYQAVVLAREARRSEEHTSELQSRQYLVCRLLLEKKKHHT